MLRQTALAAISILSLAVFAEGESGTAGSKAPSPAETQIFPPVSESPALPPPAAETPASPSPAAEAAKPEAPTASEPAAEADAGAAAMPESDAPPPTAKPGECYARVNVPPEVTTVQEQVLKHEAYQKVEVVPAVYQNVEENVLVKEASKRIEVVPAEYETQTEQVLVRPATSRMEVVPAEYDEVKEQVLVRAGSTNWQQCPPTGGKSKSTGDDTDVRCLVEVPPVYQTVTKLVVKKPETTREVPVPAEYTTVTKTVMKTPPTTREVDVPPEYKKVIVTKEVSPAKEVKVDVPAEYQTVTRIKRVSEGRTEWRSILCRADATPEKVMDIQKALKEAGYNPGKIDGVLSTRTFTAIYAYQKDKNLPIDYGTYLNLDTLTALGINPH
ncbi:MAG TPA: peptidoglycan-binding domain-containing protein [Gammaproteobacteria bacterium]|nr:peptidoglycan-binding domain-containing protein [Gammaproteobacteria bacterium]